MTEQAIVEETLKRAAEMAEELAEKIKELQQMAPGRVSAETARSIKSEIDQAIWQAAQA